jgi:hypothetical protein
VRPFFLAALLLSLTGCASIELPHTGSGYYPYRGMTLKLDRQGCFIKAAFVNTSDRTVSLPYVKVLGLDANNSTIATALLRFEPTVPGGRADTEGTFPGSTGLGCTAVTGLALH